MAKIYEVFGTNAHEMTMTLMQASNAAAMIPKGASIALKPNLVLAGEPETGATTHPGVLSGCIAYLQGEGFSNICVMEGSWVGDRTDCAMKLCGYDRVCEKYGVPFYDLKKDKTRTVHTPLRDMEITSRALDTDFLIDLPVLKGHCQTLMTCALKNLKGCLPDREKRRFHADGLIEPIAALGATLKPALTIVDSICGDLNFEEGGNPVQTNRMYLGTDPVQIDAYGCRLMGLQIEDVPYIQLAEKWDAGSTTIREGDIITLNEPVESRDYPLPSGLVERLTRQVKADSACSACYASLVRGLYMAHEEGIQIHDEIVIGQAYRGKNVKGIGIGNCCAGTDHCVKGCPPTASDVLALLRTVERWFECNREPIHAKTLDNKLENKNMGTFNEIMKRIHEAANMEVADGETTRVRISIRNGKVETFTEVIPDIDSLSLEQLYELREKYEAQVDEMNEAEPDEVRNPVEYESWEEVLDQLEQDLDEVNEMIEQVEQEIER